MKRVVVDIFIGLLAGSSGMASAADVLLIPDSNSDNIWMFDAHDGTMISDSFITDPGTDNGTDVINRPIEVLIAADGSLLVIGRASCRERVASPV